MPTIPYDEGDSSGSIQALNDAAGNPIPAGVLYYSLAGVATPWTGAVTLASTTITGTVTVVGAAAHDAAVSGNPVLVGGFASASTPAAVSDGDAARLWVTRNGAAAAYLVDSTGLPCVTGGRVQAEVYTPGGQSLPVGGYDPADGGTYPLAGTYYSDAVDVVITWANLRTAAGAEIDLAGFVAAFLDCYDATAHAIRTTPA